MGEQQTARLIGAAAIAFGACALLMPRRFAQLAGVPDPGREMVYLLRFVGSTNAGLGLNLISASDAESRRRGLRIAVAVDGLNAVLAVPAGLSKRATAFNVVANGAVAVGASLPLIRDRG